MLPKVYDATGQTYNVSRILADTGDKIDIAAYESYSPASILLHKS